MIGNAGEFDNFGWDGATWIFKVFVDLDFTYRHASLHVDIDSQHGQLNDAFGTPIKTSGFSVQNQDALGWTTCALPKIQDWHQASFDFVIGVCRKLVGHVVKIHRSLA